MHSFRVVCVPYSGSVQSSVVGSAALVSRHHSLYCSQQIHASSCASCARLARRVGRA
jgi:hypothetical protein